MQAKMCSRCGKNVAIVFITRVEGNEQKNEGLCLKCARELHIKPVDDMLEKMGISDEDLDRLSGDMMNALSGAESLMVAGRVVLTGTTASFTASVPKSTSSYSTAAPRFGKTVFHPRK